MSDEKTYEHVVDDCAKTRSYLDIILHPMYSELKKAFEIIFAQHGFSGKDLKRLVDMVHYQGGYPSENSPPKEVELADIVASVIKMEQVLGRKNFVDYLAERGISVRVTVPLPLDETYHLTVEEDQEVVQRLAASGHSEPLPTTLVRALAQLVEWGNALQTEICGMSDSVKIDAAAEVEEKFNIKKSSFMTAVKLASLKLSKDEDKMNEKLLEYLELLQNKEDAVEPLK